MEREPDLLASFENTAMKAEIFLFIEKKDICNKAINSNEKQKQNTLVIC